MSHERKLKSYAAEAAFYTHYSERVLASGSAAAIAEALLVDVSPPTHFLFVLTDLRVGFPHERHALSKQVGTTSYWVLGCATGGMRTACEVAPGPNWLAPVKQRTTSSKMI